MISTRLLGTALGFMSAKSRSTCGSLGGSSTLSSFKSTAKDLAVKTVQFFMTVIFHAEAESVIKQSL